MYLRTWTILLWIYYVPDSLCVTSNFVFTGQKQQQQQRDIYVSCVIVLPRWTNVLSNNRQTDKSLRPVNSFARQWNESTPTKASVHISNFVNSLLAPDWLRGFCLRYLWVLAPTHNQFAFNSSFTGTVAGKIRQYMRKKISGGKMMSWKAHLFEH